MSLSLAPFIGLHHGAEFKLDRSSILCLTRADFSRDTQALATAVPQYNWLTLSAADLTRVQDFIPPELRCQASYLKSFNSPVWDTAEELAHDLLRKCIDRTNLKAVVAANIDYCTDEGMRRACYKFGIPFLVILREHPLFPWAKNNCLQYLRDYAVVPHFDGIAVAGQASKDVLLESGVAFADQIAVTGLPRFDAYIGEQPQRHEDSIVLFSYADPDYCACRNFYEALVDFEAVARRNPGTRFIVKCKSAYEMNDLHPFIKEYLNGGSLVFTSDMPVPELYARAKVAIGFNTMALLEGLLTPTPLLVPYWGEAKVPSDKMMFARDDRQIGFLEHHFDFTGNLAAFAVLGNRSNFDMLARRHLLQQYIDFDMLTPASTKVMAFIERFIK